LRCFRHVLADDSKRIVWACYPTDVETAIAAQIFVAAGVLILFLVNLVFAQRMIRAAHPIIGWHRAFHYTFAVLYGLIPGMLVMVITATVQSFYTLSATTHRIDRDMQLAAGSYLMFVSFLPIPMVVLCLLVRRKTRLEKFGTGRWRTKAAILLVSSALLCMGATFRIATSYKNPRPLDNPAWYHAKWCFYLFNFTVEIIVIYLFLAFRVDRRFHVPNKSKGPGDYAREYGVGEDEKQPEEPGRGSTVTRVVSNQERYDGQSQQDLEAGKPHETRV
jgi:hypothetical protein